MQRRFCTVSNFNFRQSLQNDIIIMMMIIQFYVLNLDIPFLYSYKCQIFLLLMIKQDVKINLSLYEWLCIHCTTLGLWGRVEVTRVLIVLYLSWLLFIRKITRERNGVWSRSQYDECPEFPHSTLVQSSPKNLLRTQKPREDDKWADQSPLDNIQANKKGPL